MSSKLKIAKKTPEASAPKPKVTVTKPKPDPIPPADQQDEPEDITPPAEVSAPKPAVATTQNIGGPTPAALEEAVEINAPTKNGRVKIQVLTRMQPPPVIGSYSGQAETGKGSFEIGEQHWMPADAAAQLIDSKKVVRIG
jgi:hypothetical protein